MKGQTTDDRWGHDAEQHRGYPGVQQRPHDREHSRLDRYGGVAVVDDARLSADDSGRERPESIEDGDDGDDDADRDEGVALGADDSRLDGKPDGDQAFQADQDDEPGRAHLRNAEHREEQLAGRVAPRADVHAKELDEPEFREGLHQQKRRVRQSQSDQDYAGGHRRKLVTRHHGDCQGVAHDAHHQEQQRGDVADVFAYSHQRRALGRFDV